MKFRLKVSDSPNGVESQHLGLINCGWPAFSVISIIISGRRRRWWRRRKRYQIRIGITRSSTNRGSGTPTRRPRRGQRRRRSRSCRSNSFHSNNSGSSLSSSTGDGIARHSNDHVSKINTRKAARRGWWGVRGRRRDACRTIHRKLRLRRIVNSRQCPRKVLLGPRGFRFLRPLLEQEALNVELMVLSILVVPDAL